MASPQAEAARAEQEAIAALAVPLAAQAWPSFDAADLSTVPSFREVVEAIVELYGRAASGAAAEWFKTLRAEKVKGRIAVRAIPSTPPGFIDQTVVEAAAARMADGVDVLGSRVEQLVLNEGRRQMLSAVHADAEARGWARVPNEGACSFCLMLAIRAGAGVLYTSRSSANFRAHTKQSNGSGGDCRCGVEPVWGQYEPPKIVRDAMVTWGEATKGRSGADARAAFRQAIEGRPVTGSPGKSSKSKRGDTYAKPSGVTPENQRAQLAILEALPPAQTPEAAAWRVRRVAEIRKFLGE
jgi:hypothetical protein